MEPSDSKCYHVCAGGVSTVSVGTQSPGSFLNANAAPNNGNNNATNNTESTLNKSKAQLNSGNYINIVPMPIGVQYHQRRKYSQQMQSDYQSSRIFFSGSGDYASRERCREDYYTLASTPVPLSDVETITGGLMPPHSSTSASAPLSISVQHQQQHQQQQSPLPQPNVSSVLYTVQRVITTSQIQTSGPIASSNISTINDSRNGQEIIECSGNAGPSNATYQIHSHQNVSQPNDAQTTQNPNAFGSPPNNSASNSSSSITRPLQNVIPTCVYLMSRVAVHMEIEETNQCPAQVILAAALGCEELGISNKLLAQSVFGLWMTSPLLEVQLKPHNRPFSVRVAWAKLLHKYSTANALQKKFDEPMIQLKRNVFLAKRDEEKIKDPRIIELLYEEARHNVLNGRYVLEAAHSTMLGGIQARIELGPYNMHSHTISFFRENQFRFLPQHIAKNANWSWMPVSRKTSAEVKLLEQFKRVPTTATTRKLMRKYLEFCWALPFYGSAFFHAQVEQPSRGVFSMFNQRDVDVLVAINERGLFIIDQVNNTLLLGLKYEEFSWDFARPSTTDDADCLPCVFIQFDAVDNGLNVSKLMQVFSKQAPMMDALISHFAEQMRNRRESEHDQPTESVIEEPNPIQSSGNGVLCNKLSRLTLATFDDDGRCIGQMGSLSISY